MAKTESSTQPLRAAAVVAGITAAAAVVGAAARGPLSRSTPIDASSASAPVTALSFLLLGAGTVALTALGILIFRQRRRKDDPEDHASEPPEIPWIWKVAGDLAPFALGAALILAAVTGSKKLPVAPDLSGGFGGGFGGASGRPRRRPAGGPASSCRPGCPGRSWRSCSWRLSRASWCSRSAAAASAGRRPEPAAAGEAVQAAIAALEADTDPRGAVIAAYAAMQRTLAAHGLGRSPSEAPREFLRRVLVASRAAEPTRPR